MIWIWVWLIKYTMFHVLLGLIKWLIRHKTPKKLFWHTAKKYKMGNIFINLETLGDLRQIFLPSLILNVFFCCSTVQKYCFWIIFIFFINVVKSFLLEIVQVRLVNGRHYEEERIAQQQPSEMTSIIQKMLKLSLEG